MTAHPSPPTITPAAPHGRWGAVVGMLVVFALSWAVFGVSASVIKMPPTWLTFEFCQYAEIGKNLATEGRFDTRLVEPMALAVIDREWLARRPDRWPVVNRYPLPCLVVAAWMKLLGPTDLAAACSNGLALAILAATTYAAARHWFGLGWAAAVALVFLANPSFYGEFLLLGTPDPWFAAVFLLELLAWSSFDPSDPRPRLRWAVGLGVLGGLGYLGRFNASIFLVIQALALLRHRRWRETAVMTASTLAIAAPMLAYNGYHFGKPFVSIYSAWNLLDRIGAYRVEPWLYYRVPDLLGELSAHWRGFAFKFVLGLADDVAPKIWSLWRLDVLMPLALVGPWLARKGSGYRRFAGWSVGLFALQLVLFSALRLEIIVRDSPHSGRYFFWFAAPAVLIGVGTLRRLAQGRRWVLGLATLAVVGQLAISASAWSGIARWHLSEPSDLGHDAIRTMIGEVVAPGLVIASNQPHVSAWHQGIRSISLPADLDELDRLNRMSPTPADYLLVDEGFNTIDLDPRWRALTQRQGASPWEPRLLRDYEYVIPPDQTRGLFYVFLRRKGIPPSRLERSLRR